MITLAQDLFMHQSRPDIWFDEVFRLSQSRKRVERSSPGYQAVEIECRCTSNNAVEVTRILDCICNALPSTLRAAEEVGLVVLVTIELLDDILAHSHACVKCSIGKVVYHVRVLIKCIACSAIVTVVRRDCSEAMASGIDESSIVETCENVRGCEML